MSYPLPTMYPEDLSGLKASNLVPNEVHRPSGTINRVIVPEHGPFFVESVKIIDLTTGLPVAPHVQWQAAQLEDELTLQAGKEICSVISITDQGTSGVYAVTYQTVGGPYSYSVKSIVDMVEQLDLDNRPIYWHEILGKPDRYVPAPHPHHINDVGGWPVLFPALAGIEKAILLTDQAVLDAIRTGFRAEIVRIDALIAAEKQKLFDHLNDFANPHRLHIHDINGLTAAEINLILTRYLPIDGTAVNSQRFNGWNYLEHRNWILAATANSEWRNGLFNRENIGNGWNPAIVDPVLVGWNWRSAKDLLSVYSTSSTYYAGTATPAQIAVAYSDIGRYPVGTMVSYYYDYSVFHAYGNGGGYYTYHQWRGILQRWDQSTWQVVGAYST